MNSSDYFFLGKIVRTVGLKGEFAVQLDVDDPSRYKNVEEVFLGANREKRKVNSSRVNGMQLVISIEGTKDIDEAKQLVNHELFLPIAELPELDEKRFYFHEIKGYKVIDSEKGELGIAQNVLERMIQSVLVIKHGYDEILIPLTEDIIDKV
ncbi:MAG TPA: ribosome maturation factor RimM, partial [Bacteroidia bacterium]|nr:ribosome maturation factor RimM [Bacteroidia bacterium]